jgi:tryptophanyl-tRNA synthetase
VFERGGQEDGTGLMGWQVPAHSELMWILSCTASMGYLSRMTQWKVCL